MDRECVCRASGSEQPFIMLDYFQIDGLFEGRQMDHFALVFKVIKTACWKEHISHMPFQKGSYCTEIPIQKCRVIELFKYFFPVYFLRVKHLTVEWTYYK